mmetsp:Transcript_9303/g.21859  ORF Transcript_9303/g.21859 Transcript_9303/m.21859 type:complete len:589 (-) Transcript_9303:78-1844(-)
MPSNDDEMPRSVVEKLAGRGYEVETSEPPLDLGAEKFVYGALVKDSASERTGVVVLYSKKAGRGLWAWKYQRELEVFQDLRESGQEHQNIIRMLDFLPPTQDGRNAHGPCMVLERVDPLGFDMFKVVKQYQGAKERTLPVAQWMHYLGQLIEAVECLHSRGWVHCDLKPDNVMVSQGHEIKVIDFGFARRCAKESCPGRVSLYAPPEFTNTRRKVEVSADLWLIGAMMFVVFAQMQVCFRTPDGQLFEVTNHQHAKKHGVTAAIRQWWGKKVDPVIGEAIDNLLRREPEERWTLPRLRDWWRTVKGNLDREALLPLPKNSPQSRHTYFSKAPPLDRLVKAFGLQVTANSEFVGKYIGSHEREDGTRIEGKDQVIDFRKFAGATVLFIDRGSELVKLPSAKDQVQKDDWVYYLLHEELEMETEEQREFQRQAAEVRSVGVEIWLEFDWFEFPDHCAGASLGEIGMGKRFGINVHFIARDVAEEDQEGSVTRFIEVHRDSVILPGDKALVCRVPDRDTGRSHSILSDKLLSPLFSEGVFRSRLGLADEDAWEEWSTRRSLRITETQLENPSWVARPSVGTWLRSPAKVRL